MSLPSFPHLSNGDRLRRLELPPGRLPVVIDTDTWNEIDDQFALAYALLSPERIDLQAVHIAPFSNERCTDPAESLELSRAEAARVFSALDVPSDGKLFLGLGRYLGRDARPESTPASHDLIRRAFAQPADTPLVVVAIGAITNIANALLLEPRLVERLVVVWLGAHALHWPDHAEFNFDKDIRAARIVFDSGVPLVHVPCCGVASHLLISYPEVEAHIEPCGRIGAFLAGIYRDAHPDRWGNTHTLWDTVTIAYLINPGWVPHGLVGTPVVNDNRTFSQDIRRPPMKYAYFVHRDAIIRDFLTKLRHHAQP